MAADASRGLRKAFASFEGLDTHEQAAFLTLPLLLLHVDPFWYLKIPIIVLVLVGLIFSDARRSASFWFLVTCFLASGVYQNWLVVDNHKYLLTYWCLAICASLAALNREESLRISARSLIALTFLFATFWKLASPDFLSADFFQHELLFDPRFNGKLEALGLIDPASLELNKTAHHALMAYDSTLTSVELAGAPLTRHLAVLMTGWTLAIEFLVAAAFVVPLGWRLSRWRHGLLLVFIVCAYAIAPVIGFGWLLIVMGFTACDRSRRKTRRVYVVTLLLIQVFRLPWRTTLGALIG